MELGPMYNVPLIDVLPLGGSGMKQQMASRADLAAIARKHPRVVAAYEVLMSHYQNAVTHISGERERRLIGWILERFADYTHGCVDGDCPHQNKCECVESIIQAFNEHEEEVA